MSYNSEYQREYYLKNRYGTEHDHRKWYLKSRYGITPEIKEAMWEAQDRKCAICQKDIPLWTTRGANVDHNHTTGEVRGLLCPRCNTVIGFLESELWAERLEKYREQYEKSDHLD